MFWNSCCSLIFFSCLLLEVKCQFGINAPPSLSFNRKWEIMESEPVGHHIIQIHPTDKAGPPIFYGLEAKKSPTGKKSTQELPFAIDRITGDVYLNGSLEGKGGEDMYLYVTASDGGVTSKYEVLVNVLDNPSTPELDGKLKNALDPPAFLLANSYYPPPFKNSKNSSSKTTKKPTTPILRQTPALEEPKPSEPTVNIEDVTTELQEQGNTSSKTTVNIEDVKTELQEEGKTSSEATVKIEDVKTEFQEKENTLSEPTVKIEDVKNELLEEGNTSTTPKPAKSCAGRF